MIYNDAYSQFAGSRHAKLLGSKVREGWPEVADFNDNVMKVGLAGGTLNYHDQELTLDRFGAPAKAWAVTVTIGTPLSFFWCSKWLHVKGSKR